MFGIAVAMVGGFALLAYLVTHEKEKSEAEAVSRNFPLVKGKRYAILYQVGPVFADANEIVAMLTSMGFCNVESVQPMAGQIQVVAYWCLPNQTWEVPVNVSITEY